VEREKTGGVRGKRKTGRDGRGEEGRKGGAAGRAGEGEGKSRQPPRSFLEVGA